MAMNVAISPKIGAKEYLQCELSSDVKHELIDGEVCLGNDGWLPKHYFLGDQFSLESIGLSLSVEEIYHRVDNDDVMTYLHEQQTNANFHL